MALALDTVASEKYDVIAIGVDGIGSTTTYQLARRGVDVLGLERFDIPHEQGSTHSGDLAGFHPSERG